MSTQSLGSPVISPEALRSVNFFNGRLLTGDDLSEEQSTHRAQLQRLGQVAGEGIAFGLEVQETGASSTSGNPIVTVNAGLALSRSGLVLSLPAAVDIALVTSTPVASTESGGLFAPCQPSAPGTYTAGAGVYLLWMGPASQSEGLAAVNGLGNKTAPCNVDDYVQTVQFGLIRIALTPDELADTEHLRSQIASMCFAPQVLAAFTANPFGSPPTTYGLIDELRAQLLTDDQVPLAIFGWDRVDGIQFVDLWSVRRRVIRPAVEDDFETFAGDRRRAEGEAMFLQFQATAEDLRSGPAPQAITAKSAFAFLPAAGLLPLRSTGWPHGFDLAAFFTDLTTRGPVYINGAEADALIQRSFTYPPIPLTGGEVTWQYLVRENSAALPSGGQGYALFASGHIPYAANARFDLSAWDYSNYGLV